MNNQLRALMMLAFSLFPAFAHAMSGSSPRSRPDYATSYLEIDDSSQGALRGPLQEHPQHLRPAHPAPRPSRFLREDFQQVKERPQRPAHLAGSHPVGSRPQQMIGEDEIGHGFQHRKRPGNDARIVTPLLCHIEDARSRLETHA